jgi:hypothetical protein
MEGRDSATLCDIMVTILTVSKPGFKKQKNEWGEGTVFEWGVAAFCLTEERT